MKNTALVFKLFPQGGGIDNIAVVGQGQPAFDMIDHNRLGIMPVGRPGRAVADMAEGHVSKPKRFHGLFVENIVD